jgi:site-specific recombinase XerC
MANTGEGLIAVRDRALLLLGFAGAFRRSELVALDYEDVEEIDAGVKVTIRRAKTDQEGAGAKIAIVRGSLACPVAALRAWRNAAGITTGAVFRSVRKGGRVGARLTDRSVAEIIKLMQLASVSTRRYSRGIRCARASSRRPLLEERRFSR